VTENRSLLYDRLRAVGLWAEAAEWKNDRVRELRASGMTRGEATEEAWRLLELQYPPPPPLAEPEPDPVNDNGEDVVVVGSSLLPDAWGELPDSASFETEVEWVHQNRVLVVEERPGGRAIIHWDRARRPAPSYGAVNLMEFAATNRKGFMDILQRVKPGNSGEDELLRRDKVPRDEIIRILDGLGETAKNSPLAKAEE
jgi:hypothetical protein